MRLARGEAELESDGSITPRGLFPDALLPRTPVIPCPPDFDEGEGARFEMEWLGFTTALNPMQMQEKVHDAPALPLAEAPSHVGRDVQIQAWLAAMRRHRARPGRAADGRPRGGGWMCFLTFEDETGMLEAVLFSDVYRRFGGEIAGQGLYRVRGRLESREGAIAPHAHSLEALD